MKLMFIRGLQKLKVFEIRRRSRKVASLFGGMMRSIRLSGGWRRLFYLVAKAVRKAAILYSLIKQNLGKTAGRFGDTMRNIRRRAGGGKLLCFGVNAARKAALVMGALMIAAAIAVCVLWTAGGEGESAIMLNPGDPAHKPLASAGIGAEAQAAVPTPIALYYAQPMTTPEPEKPMEPGDHEPYAIAPKKENAAPEPEEEMTAKEMFEQEFPGEDYEKTKRVLARVIHGEAKGTKSVTNRAAVVETILNRVDAGMRGKTPYKCATARSQFCVGRTCTEEELWIAEDVLKRWLKIRRGEDAAWILPKDYLWFYGTYPKHDWNVFRNRYRRKDKPNYMTPLHSEVYGD